MSRDDLDRHLARFERRLPAAMARVSRWLRGPSSRWVRIPLAIVLVLAGFVGFLPVLGFWMIPLGLLVLSHEYGWVRRHRRRMVVWWERRRRPRDE